MRASAIPASLLALICASQEVPSKAAQVRTPLQRDVQGYAVASCLARQKDPVLKDQGLAWLDVIVQRSEGDIEDFKAVADAVDARLATGPMPMAHQESDPMHSKALPMLLCGEIIDEPSVRAAIDKAMTRLAPSYRHKRR